VLNSVSNVIQGVAQIKDSLNAIKQAQANGGLDLFGGLSAGMGIAGGVFAAIGVVKGIADAMNAKDEARAKRAAEQQQYAFDMQVRQNEAIITQLDRQLSIIKDMYGTQRLEEYKQAIIDANQEYNKLFEGLKKGTGADSSAGLLQLTGNKDVDDVIARYNAGQSSLYSVLSLAKSRGVIDSIQSLDSLIDKLNDPSQKDSALAELQKLMDAGLIDEATASTIKSLSEINSKIKETLNAINAEVTGFTLDSLIDDIVGLFADGGDLAGDAFNKSFDEQVQKSLLKRFKRDYLEKQLQDYYTLFANLSETGGSLDKDEIAELRKEYERVLKEAQQKFADMEAVTGVDINNPSDKGSNQNTLPGAIRGQLTEETGSKLAGIYQGIFGLNKQQLVNLETISANSTACYDIAKQQLYYQERIEFNTRLNAESSVRIEGQLGQMGNSLNTIVTNTKPGQSSRDLGLGG